MLFDALFNNAPNDFFAVCPSIAALTFHINYYVAGVLNVFQGGKLEIRDKYSFDMINRVVPGLMKKWAKEMGATNVGIIPQGVDPNIMKSLEPDKELQNELKIQEKDQIIIKGKRRDRIYGRKPAPEKE